MEDGCLKCHEKLNMILSTFTVILKMKDKFFRVVFTKYGLLGLTHWFYNDKGIGDFNSDPLMLLPLLASVS